jgi:hypothetical protein
MEPWDRQWEEELKTEAFLLSSMFSNQALLTDTPLPREDVQRCLSGFKECQNSEEKRTSKLNVANAVFKYRSASISMLRVSMREQG